MTTPAYRLGATVIEFLIAVQQIAIQYPRRQTVIERLMSRPFPGDVLYPHRQGIVYAAMMEIQGVEQRFGTVDGAGGSLLNRVETCPGHKVQFGIGLPMQIEAAGEIATGIGGWGGDPATESTAQ